MKLRGWSLEGHDRLTVSTFTSSADGTTIVYASLIHDDEHDGHHKRHGGAHTTQTQPPRVTVVILQGWKETLLKYDEIMLDLFKKRGFNVFAMDHRSQGLSGDTPGTPLLPEAGTVRFGETGHKDGSGRRLCHVVDDFDSTYVSDARQFLTEVVRPAVGYESTVCLLGRSMGGAIVTRLAQTCPTTSSDGAKRRLFDRAVAMEPMYSHKNVFDVGGLVDVELPLGAARTIANIMCLLGLGGLKADGRDTNASVPTTELLTHCPKKTVRWNEIRARNPNIVLAGASFAWVRAAFEFERRITADGVGRIDVPLLLFQAEDDSFVYNDAHDEFAKKQTKNNANVRLVGPVRGTYHEILMELEDARKPVLDAICAFAEASGSGAGNAAFSPEVERALDAVRIATPSSVAAAAHRGGWRAARRRRRWPGGHHSGLSPPSWLPVPLVFRDRPVVRDAAGTLVKGAILAAVAGYGYSMLRK